MPMGGRRNLPSDRSARLKAILDMGNTKTNTETKRSSDSKQISPMSQYRKLGSAAGGGNSNTPFASGNTNPPFCARSPTPRNTNTPFASRYCTLGHDGFPTNSLKKSSSGDSLPGLSHRIRSAPALAGGMRRGRKYGSNDSLASVASSRSSASNTSQMSGRKNAMVQMAQRSNAASVKTVINELRGICAMKQEEQAKTKDTDGENNDAEVVGGDKNDENDLLSPPEVSTNEALEPPLQECAMLAQWSVDAYYKVVISKYNGIDAIVLAMDLYPQVADIQAYGCTVLKNMSNKMLVHQSRGTAAIFSAMKHHPTSIHVQSEACEALHNGLAKMLLQMAHQEEFETMQTSNTSFNDSFAVDRDESNNDDDTATVTVAERLDDVIPLLQHATDMYLTQHGREAAQSVLAMLLPYASSKIRFKRVEEDDDEEELDAQQIVPNSQNHMSLHSSIGMESFGSTTPPPPTKRTIKTPSSPINMEITM